jgi:multiple sugar transport system ATP-binding protein
VASVELREITVRFPDGPPALDRLDLWVQDGELMVIAGPSGSGKTTVLRVVAGFQKPTDGSVWLDDRDVTHLDPIKRDLAMVFQEYALYPQRTAEGNIAFPLEARRVKPPAERTRRVHAEARHLRIEHILGKKPGELSAGHQQAVATARSLVRSSAALLMDEPLANLDAHLRTQGRVEVKRIHRELGATFLYVTNDQAEAMALGDRIAVLDAGRLQQVGTPRDVYFRPRNTMVAGFLGTPPMNLLPAELARSGGDVELLVGNDRLRLDDGVLDRYPDYEDRLGVPIMAGVRSEHLRPAGGGEPFAQTLHGRVASVEDHGSTAIVTVDLGVRGVTALVSMQPPIPARPGDPIELAVAMQHLVIFDPQSGDAL